MKKPYKPLTKSRKNNSGKKSQAKREAEAESFAMRNPKKTVMKTKRKGRERLAQGIPYKEKPLQSMTVRQLPESDLIRKGMTLRQLIRATPRFFLVGAVDVEAVQVDIRKTKTNRPVIAGRMVTYFPWKGSRIRRVHESFIVGMGEDFDQPVNRHKRVLVQCSCIGGSNYVLTSDGHKQVHDISIEKKDLPTCEAVEYVISGRIHVGTPPFKSGSKQLYRFEMSTGLPLDLTMDHRVLTSRNPEIWTEAKDLKVGSHIMPNIMSVQRKFATIEGEYSELLDVAHTLMARGTTAFRLKRYEGTNQCTLEYDAANTGAVTVENITPIGEQIVYDIYVPDVHRFATQGLLVHNCESFVYTFEYANAANGVSRLIYCNGAPPLVTNPGFSPGMCKHLIALSKIAIEKEL